MKLGLVGHKKSIQKIKNVIDKSFSNINTIDIDFVDVDQIPTLVAYLKSLERNLDGIMFTGNIPYEYMNKAMISKTPWVYIERTHSQLTRALLKASYVYKYDILNVSIDSYDTKLVNSVYHDIGILNNLSHVYSLDNIKIDSDLLNRLKSFHVENYVLNNVTFCMTGITSIYEFLVDKKIPCVLIEATDSLIKETVQTIIYKHKTKISQERHIVALSVEIDSQNEFSVINENEYQVMLNKMKVTEEIYKFAQKIQAAVVELGFKGYLLFSTKNILENETNELKKIDLLKDVGKNTNYTISLGIGYGVTAREAKYNANLGMIRAFKTGGNKAYVVENGKYLGPIYYEKNTNKQYEIIDSNYRKIADETGLSVNKIFSLCCIVEQHKKDYFTSSELADYLNLSNRSVNRIINKLEVNNYAKIIGKRVVSKAGRPSRIIKLVLK